MDERKARKLIADEREQVKALLADTEGAAAADRSAEDEPGDWGDRAEPLADQGRDDAVAAAMRQRLKALDRAERRLDEGTFGLSVRSGRPISDEQLEADPAAELRGDEVSPS